MDDWQGHSHNTFRGNLVENGLFEWKIKFEEGISDLTDSLFPSKRYP